MGPEQYLTQMRHLTLNRPQPLRSLLCVGAHCDDLEIGCGGTVLALLRANPHLHVRWVVFSSTPVRESEARASATAFLSGAREVEIVIKQFRDGYFPFHGASIKDFFEELKRDTRPDLILTHHEADHHQDHRVLAELTWNTFRNHLILGYEIPKYDGDLGQPNVFVPLPESLWRTKIDLILRHFVSQRGQQWFTAETFQGLMRLRGIECNSPSGYAEAFFAPKISLALE